MSFRKIRCSSFFKHRTRILFLLRHPRAPYFTASRFGKVPGPPSNFPIKGSQPVGLLESSIASTSATSIVIIISLLAAGLLYFFPSEEKLHVSVPTYEITGSEDTREYTIMPATLPPGRPGNLTAEQEAKLRDMWAATLSVFGVPGFADINRDAASTTKSEGLEQTEQQSLAGTLNSDKKKKKRTGMFGRKQNDDVASDSPNGASAMDGDDKYGQTKAYQKLLESQSPEEIRKAFWSMVKHDNPDGLLLRFLRARKWDVQNALIMLVAAMHWRMQEMHVDDDIIKRGEAGSLADSQGSTAAVKKEGEDFLAQMRLGKSFLHGTDREGRPMCFVRVRLHKQGEQSETSVERYTVYTIETARYLLGSNIDTAVSLQPI